MPGVRTPARPLLSLLDRARARRELGELLRLAGPLILAQLAQTGMNTVDTLMAGRLGQSALAGIALGAVVYGLVLVASMGILLSVAPVVSQAIGGEDRNQASRAARQGLWLATGLFVPGFIVLNLAEPALLALGQNPATVELAGGYLGAVSFGLLPTLLLVASRGFLEGIGDTRPIMVVHLVGIALNVVANDALMFGRWGLPALGLVGTGVATTLVYTLMTSGLLIYVATRHRAYRVLRGLRKPDPTILRELLRVGWPIGLTLGFEVGLFSIAAILMGLFGEAALAGHQIALQAASITFMVPLGLASATGIRTARAMGANDPEAVRRAGLTGLAVAIAFMLTTAALFRFAPHLIVAAFLDPSDPANAGAVAYAVTFLGFAALFQVVDGMQVTAAGALRGLKDTRGPMVISLLSYWGIGLGTAVVLAFPLGMEGDGLWLGLVAGLAVAAVLLTRRFLVRTRKLAASQPTVSRQPAG